MHYYPHHIGDYARDTAHLSLTEHGAYRLLIDNYYVTQKCLPTDAESLHRICRAMSKAERAAVDFVAAQFFTPTDNGLRHKRIEEEIADYQRQAQTNRENGKKGGRPPSGKPNGKPKNNPMGSQTVSETLTQTVTETKGNQEPRTSTPLIPQGGEGLDSSIKKVQLPFDSPGFAEIWKRWRTHRTEIRKPLKPTQEAEQLREMQALGELRATACILHTIAKGWQGLREPDNQPNTHTSHANHRHTAPRSDTANAPGRYA